MSADAKRRAWIRGGFGAGAGAALVMMLVMAVLRLTTNTISIPELMEESLIWLIGGRNESFFINQLGVGGKALLLVSIVEGTLLLGGLLGLLFSNFWTLRTKSARWTSGLLYGLLVGLFLNVVFLPLVQQGPFGSNALQVTAPAEIARALYGSDLAPIGLPVWVSMFLLSIAFGLALVALLPYGSTETVVATPAQAQAQSDVTGYAPASAPALTYAPAASSEQVMMGRRDFSKGLGGVAAAILGGAGLWAVIRRALEPPRIASAQPVEAVPGAQTPVAQGTQAAGAGAATGTGFEGVKPVLVPEVTPVDAFYITTKNFVDPTLDGNAWKLTFKGLVDKPYSITLKDLMSLPSSERTETLACISNSIGGPLIGNAKWKGVDFATLLAQAGPKQGVVDVVVRGADGYSDSFPLSVAMDNKCFLAYEMNGAPLTPKHGYPARLLVPNIYGMKNCKWITEVELVNNDYKGYWEAQGWDDVAHYQTMSRIDYPDNNSIPAKPVYIGGVAFAGNRGIKRVEVTTDGGKSWNDAILRAPMSEWSWVQWTFPWKPEKGDYTLQVRATDGTGTPQTADAQDTYPSGATGYHTKQVRVG